MKHSLESTIIRLMLLVRRVGAKMGGSLWLLQRILSSLLPADDIDVADEPVHLDADLAPLLAMLPGKKRYGSCLRDNDLSHKDDYDLEIIIPAYNVEQYIDQCLQSVLNQRSKYKCLIVVINDGSTDDTRQHLANYENCPDIEIIDQKNAGLAAARNAALRHIRGRYVTFVDSDDWLLPGAVDVLMDTATQHDADIVEGCFRLFIGARFYPGYSHPFEVYDCWTGQLQGYACGKVLRAELFAHVCFPEGYLFEDTLMTLILFPRCHRIVTIPDDIYVYRFNPVGITATAGLSPRAVESLLVTIQLMEDGATSGQQTSQQTYENFLLNEVPNTFLFLALPFRQPSCLRHLLPSATSVLRRLHDVRPALATFGTRTPHQRLPCLHACGDDKTLTMTKLW